MKRILLLPILFLSFAQAETVNGMNLEDLNVLIKDYQNEDKDLNVIYDELYRSLDGVNQKNLKKSELSWIKYRDDSCSFRYKLFGNSNPEKYQCLRDLTRQRVIELSTTNGEFSYSRSSSGQFINN